MNKYYTQLEFTSGMFFQYSKDEAEGFEKHTSTKGNVSYRKYHKDGISGILDSVSIREAKFGNEISMTIKNGNDTYYVPVGIADQKGNVDTYAESLIKFLPQLSKGDNLTVKGYNFIPEGDKYSKIGISISKDGEKIKSTMTNAYIGKDGIEVKGDIPATIWKKDALGKNKPSAVSLEAKNEYLLEVLKVQTDRLKWVSGGQSETPAPQSAPEEKTKSSHSEPKKEEHTDLPF